MWVLFTFFSRVVGGLETLSKMEKIETDKNDKPLVSFIALFSILCLSKESIKTVLNHYV